MAASSAVPGGGVHELRAEPRAVPGALVVPADTPLPASESGPGAPSASASGGDAPRSALCTVTVLA